MTPTEDCTEDTEAHPATTAEIAIQDASQNARQADVEEGTVQQVVVPDRGVEKVVISSEQKEVDIAAEAQANKAAEQAVHLRQMRVSPIKCFKIS